MNKKIIAALTTKNEQWIIKKTLEALNKFCDKIIIYDDNSSDLTEEICRSFNKVDWFVRHKHDPLIREEAKQRLELINIVKNYDTDYLLLLDADEIPTPSIIPFLENAPSQVVGWQIRMINLWEDENKYRIDSYQTKFGTQVNWQPFSDNFWGKYPLIKFDKNFNYTYDLNVQKGGCSAYHPAPSNLQGEIKFTEDFYLIHYGKISKEFISEEKLKFYANIDVKNGKGSYEERIDWYKEHSRIDTLKTEKTKKEWLWR